MATVRARALLLGTALVVAVCFIGTYADLVIKQIQIGICQFAPAAVGILLLVVVSHRLLRWVTKRSLLSPADIAIIYAMVLVGTMITTRGFMEKLVPTLVFLNYYATPENRWREFFYRHIPPWMVAFDPRGPLRQPVAVKFYEGIPEGEPIPWREWVTPFLAWGGMALCVFTVFLCLASLLRRQWADNEKLVFPLVHAPLHILREETAGPFFRSRLAWWGFSIPAFIFLLNGLHELIPAVPAIPLRQNLTQFLVSPPWNGMFTTHLYLSFAAVGFSYFLASDLLFSLWFFFVLTRLEDVVATARGAILTNMPLYPTRLYIGYQVAGAYFVLAGYLLKTAWPYLKAVARKILLRLPEPDDREELLPYGMAVAGVALGTAGAIYWCVQAGMDLWVAAAEMGIYLFVVAVIMARSVAEAGTLMTETSFRPINIITLFTTKHSLGPRNLTIFAFLDAAFTRDLRGLLLTTFLDDLKLAEGVRLRRRSLLGPLVLAIVVALGAAAYFQLAIIYRHGNITLYTYPNSNAQWAVQDAAAAIQFEEEGSIVPPLAFAAGAIVTFLLVLMRTLFVWWPLHPLGYALSASWTLFVFWFPIFLTWLAKGLILRYGGMRLYRAAMPFFLGLIFGEFTMAVLWATFSSITRLPAPFFPWP